MLQQQVTLSEQDVILGIPSKSEVTLNYLIILLKYYIYKQRARTHLPCMAGFKKELSVYYNLDKYMYKKNLMQEKLRKLWKNFCNIFDEN